MNYNEILAAAKDQVGPYCKACPVCNGKACGNSMPGPGSKFPGNGAARNYEKWQEICVNMDTLCPNADPDVSFEMFGRKFTAPIFVAPLGEERKWVHYGLTSTDVVDTANGYLLRQANEILEKDLEAFLAVLKRRALEFRNTTCIGRTHGIHADITCFGLKWALWYEEMKRNIERFRTAARGVEVGKMSGAVGNFANIPPMIQDYVCEKLGIDSANVSTQVIQGDRHAYYIATLAVIASSLEQMALEVRNLQRTEVHEVEEAFGKGQKGSSAMPHKRNPISSENICGCARVMRGYMATACENVALWHERDISHSSTERIILPDATELLDYMLNRFKGILDNLVVFEDVMMENIYRTRKVIFAQRVMNALIDKGFSREEAYDTVQPVAMRAMAERADYQELLAENEKVMSKLSREELDEVLKPENMIRPVKLNIKPRK